MYFAAVLCPAEVDRKVLEYKNWMKDQFGCIVALKSPAHITLIPPFWLEKAKEALLLETLLSFTSDIDELTIHLVDFSHFGKKVLFVNVKENPAIEELKNQTEDHFIRSFGGVINKDDRPFHPHITIANRDMKPSDFIKAWDRFAKERFSETFRTGTISLLKLSPGKWNIIGEKRFTPI
jgi:2'-5' RNA ligase